MDNFKQKRGKHCPNTGEGKYVKMLFRRIQGTDLFSV